MRDDPRPDEAREVSPANGKALIVDDDEAVGELLAECLLEAGFQLVERARNGLESIDMYKALRPDVVVMDMEMPVMNGYESSKGIKAADPGAKVLIVTGNPTNPFALKAISDGYALELLAKPFSLKKLLELISRHIQTTAPAKSESSAG